MIRVSKPMLEKHQVAIYFITVFAGLLAATVVGRSSAALEAWINPALAALLYVTFLQVPMTSLRQVLSHGRFLLALLIVNFVAVPLVVLGLIQFLPDNPVLQFAVLLVLLAPCIDYVVVFTHLGQGNAKLILAATPILLIAQMLLLPIYLGLFLGADAAGLVQARPFLNAFFWLIAVPLVLAWLTQYWAARRELGKRVEGVMGWLPVPLNGARVVDCVRGRCSTDRHCINRGCLDSTALCGIRNHHASCRLCGGKTSRTRCWRWPCPGLQRWHPQFIGGIATGIRRLRRRGSHPGGNSNANAG